MRRMPGMFAGKLRILPPGPDLPGALVDEQQARHAHGPVPRAGTTGAALLPRSPAASTGHPPDAASRAAPPVRGPAAVPLPPGCYKRGQAAVGSALGRRPVRTQRPGPAAAAVAVGLKNGVVGHVSPGMPGATRARCRASRGSNAGCGPQQLAPLCFSDIACCAGATSLGSPRAQNSPGSCMYPSYALPSGTSSLLPASPCRAGDATRAVCAAGCAPIVTIAACTRYGKLSIALPPR